MKNLTQAQENFARLYVELGNAAEAKKRAGIGLPVPTRSFYTYLLVDPRNSKIFYVGKGTGKRVFEHEKNVRNGRIDNAQKCGRIFEILSEGLAVEHIIFSTHAKESDAYAVEKEMIALLKGEITNATSGHTTENQRAMLGAKVHLKKIKPYEVWIATVSQNVLDTAARMAGSPREFYDQHVLEMTRLSEGYYGD